MKFKLDRLRSSRQKISNDLHLQILTPIFSIYALHFSRFGLQSKDIHHSYKTLILSRFTSHHQRFTVYSILGKVIDKSNFYIYQGNYS